MIVVQLIGGLGNQMFQYALGRSLALKKGTPLKLDVSWFTEIENENTQRVYELDCYPIRAGLTDASKLRVLEPEQEKGKGSPRRRLFGKSSLTIQREAGPGFNAEILSLPDNIYFVGYWQNEKYFKAIRPILLKEFIPKRLSEYTKRTVKIIQGRPSVSLHIRRGDYADDPKTNEFHGLTPITYYTKALGYIQKKQPGLQLFIFSDDIKWCQNNLPFSKEATFVSGNPADRGYEDMYLMSLCDHNIIANSSFSWWGAWLNQNPQKMIVAPKTWFQDKSANSKMEIVPENWHRI